MGTAVPTLRPRGSPWPKVFDPQPPKPLVNPRKREFLSVGLSVPPKSGRPGRGRSSTTLGQEHRLPAQTPGPFQAAGRGEKCHVTHKVREGRQALSRQPRTWPDSELNCRAVVRPSHAISRWQLLRLLTHL